MIAKTAKTAIARIRIFTVEEIYCKDLQNSLFSIRIKGYYPE